MSTVPAQDNESDSDVEFEDVEFEDVPISHSTANGISLTVSPERRPWTPTLSLPSQQDTPIPAGSEEETQLRGRLSSGMERITYRQMKADMGMDAPETRTSLRRYESFKELAGDIEHLVDMLWASSTPSIQVEGLITLAGMLEMALPTYKFDPETTLAILHKFDVVFAALCTGIHPLTQLPLRGAVEGRPMVTQTQKVRIRSLAEMTRSKIFACLPDPDEGEDGTERDEEVEQPWLLEATRVYDRTLMLLADQGEDGGGLYAD